MSKKLSRKFDSAPDGSGSKRIKPTVGDAHERKFTSWPGRVHIHESPKKAWLAKVAESEAKHEHSQKRVSEKKRLDAVEDDNICEQSGNYDAFSVKQTAQIQSEPVGTSDYEQRPCHVTPLQYGTDVDDAVDNLNKDIRVVPEKIDTPSNVENEVRSNQVPCSESAEGGERIKCVEVILEADKEADVVAMQPGSVETLAIIDEVIKEARREKRRKKHSSKSIKKRLKLDCTGAGSAPSTSSGKGNSEECKGESEPTEKTSNKKSNKAKKSMKIKLNAPKKPVCERPLSSTPKKDDVTEGLQIDDELDRQLEANADKNNLSVINVKTILHHVITNEHVLAMVRNTMIDVEREEGEALKEGEPAVYEPTMTRSKLKEVTEKGWTLPISWPISPLKLTSRPCPQFQDLNFSDSDCTSDEDYKPEEESERESDYESIPSSQVSEFGSPCPRTPLTPQSFNIELTPTKISTDTEDNQDDWVVALEGSPEKMEVLERHVKAAVVPMGPPPPKPFLRSHTKVPQQLVFETSSTSNLSQEEEDLIAFRTRSKLPLIDTPLDLIEANFVAPDITTDMYETFCDDQEWKEWLSSLMKEAIPDANDTFDDEQNDPEYNYLAEEEPEDFEDFRNDRAVRITKKKKVPTATLR